MCSFPLFDFVGTRLVWHSFWFPPSLLCCCCVCLFSIIYSLFFSVGRCWRIASPAVLLFLVNLNGWPSQNQGVRELDCAGGTTGEFSHRCSCDSSCICVQSTKQPSLKPLTDLVTCAMTTRKKHWLFVRAEKQIVKKEAKQISMAAKDTATRILHLLAGRRGEEQQCYPDIQFHIGHVVIVVAATLSPLFGFIFKTFYPYHKML